MQFNAVVASNTHALHLYERIGLYKTRCDPWWFRMPDGHYEDIIPHSLCAVRKRKLNAL
ncbi:MAG: hypothetical protein ACLTTJ_14295 [Blautia sp.]